MNADEAPSDTSSPARSLEGLSLGPDVGPCRARCDDHLEHVYIICYGRPVRVSSRDYLHRETQLDYPIDHYVGYTRQHPPINRVRQHGARSAHYLAALQPGTMDDEKRLKLTGLCPHCGKSLWYYSLPRR